MAVNARVLAELAVLQACGVQEIPLSEGLEKNAGIFRDAWNFVKYRPAHLYNFVTSPIKGRTPMAVRNFLKDSPEALNKIQATAKWKAYQDFMQKKVDNPYFRIKGKKGPDKIDVVKFNKEFNNVYDAALNRANDAWGTIRSGSIPGLNTAEDYIDRAFREEMKHHFANSKTGVKYTPYTQMSNYNTASWLAKALGMN